MAGRGHNTKHGSAGRGSSTQISQPFVNEGGAEQLTNNIRNQKQFNLVVDDVPYMVKATPFTFNTETRYYISVNAGEEHVFTWDSQVNRLRAIDDEASILPEALEEAISARLQ